MARILLVEPERGRAAALAALLRGTGHAVDVAADGEDALDAAKGDPFALVVLALDLPGGDGLAVVRRLRRAGVRTPLLVLRDRGDVRDRIAALDEGADDYIARPFDPAELEARVRALLRRSVGQASPTVTIGRLELDPARVTATLDGCELALRRREWAVLERLASRPGRLVSKQRLTAEVFGYDDPVAPNALEVYVSRLRRKLEPGGPMIRTVRGLGYLLVAA